VVDRPQLTPRWRALDTDNNAESDEESDDAAGSHEIGPNSGIKDHRRFEKTEGVPFVWTTANENARYWANPPIGSAFAQPSVRRFNKTESALDTVYDLIKRSHTLVFVFFIDINTRVFNWRGLLLDSNAPK
jgi:hypothetical protein